MPRRFSDPHNQDAGHQDVAWSDFTRAYWVAMGVTFLIGLVTGSLWIGWKLFEHYVLAR